MIDSKVLQTGKTFTNQKGALMIVVSGEPVGQAGHVNLVEVREVFSRC